MKSYFIEIHPGFHSPLSTGNVATSFLDCPLFPKLCVEERNLDVFNTGKPLHRKQIVNFMDINHVSEIVFLLAVAAAAAA